MWNNKEHGQIVENNGFWARKYWAVIPWETNNKWSEPHDFHGLLLGDSITTQLLEWLKFNRLTILSTARDVGKNGTLTHWWGKCKAVNHFEK